MTKNILFSLFVFFFTITIQAQCPNDNTFWDDYSPAGPGLTYNDCLFGGEYATVSVVLGETYIFSLCANTLDDTEITLYNNSGGASLAYDDDGCGSIGGPSTLTWVATFTGTVDVLVDAYPCSDDFLTCYAISITWVSCSADAGTQSFFINGLAATNPLILCENDCVDILTDSNFVLPIPVAGEASELMYAVYTGVPNLAVEPDLDPNFSGSFWTGDDFSDCNDATSIILGAGVGTEIWLVPVTMDDGDNSLNPNGLIHYDNDGDGCYAMGTPIQLVFLDPIVGNAVEDCVGGTTVITLEGGFPLYSPAGNYTVTNTGPGVMVQSGPQGQTLSFSGYTLGQTLTVTVSDDGNGCPATITFLTGCSACPADAGTQTILVNGIPTTSPVLMCQGDCVDILTDSNFVLPTPVAGEAAELMYAIYTGVPNLALAPDVDPNFSTFFWTGDSFSDCNDPTSVIQGAGLGTSVWLVAVTMDDGDDNGNPNGILNYDNDGDSCWAMGTPIEIVYLEDITGVITETCTQVTITLNGGYPAYNPAGTYTVVNTGGGSMVQSGAQGQTITITGYTPGQTVSIQVSNDGNSCTGLISHITNGAPTITLDTIIHVTCNGGNNGAVNVTVVGDTLPCTYTLDMFDSWGDGWNGGFLDVVVNGTSVGTFAAAGYGSSATIVVPNGQSIELIYTAQDFENENEYDLILGGTTIFTDGPTPATGSVFTTSCVGAPVVYTYAWSNSAATQDITGLVQGSYTLSVTDPLGCITTSGPHAVNQPSAVTATIPSSTSVTCNGGNNGTATAAGTGGTGAYTYLWSAGLQTTATATGLTVGTHTVTVNDVNSCSATAVVTITQPSAVTATITSSTSVTCNGAATGSATANGTGGTGTKTYIWSNGRTTATNTGLAAGTHCVTVNDANTCSATACVVITQPSAITVTLDSTHNVNCGGSNGAVFITANGGTGGLNYLWSNTGTTQDITGLTVGSYVVTVTDANSCTATRSGIVSNIAAGTIGFTNTNPTCVGTDGCIHANVTGTMGNLGYLWSNGATADSICNLAPGTYTLTVTDTISSGGGPVMVYQEAFDGVHNWTLNVSTGTNGATPNAWATSSLEPGRAVGTCSQSGAGVGANSTLHVQNSPAITVAPPSGAVYFAGGLFFGTPYCTALGWCAETNRRAESPMFSTVGQSNMTFEFNYIANGDGLLDNASVLYNVGAGWVILTPSLKSPIGCAAGEGTWTKYTITLPAACNNQPSVRLGFNWTNNDDGIGTDPSVAIDSVVVFTTGAGGGTTVCTIINDTTLVGPSSLVTGTITTNTPISCNGGSNGAVSIAAAAGTPYLTPRANGTGYNYNWTNGSTNVSSTGLAIGTHCVTITDSLGCTDIVCVTLTQPSAVTATITSSSSVTCNGAATGSATANGTGGTGVYTYLWDNGVITPTNTGLAAGIYCVTVSDANLCTAITCVTITQPSAVTATITSSANAGCAGPDGTATAAGSGGTAAYTYLWNTSGQTTATATGLGLGTHTVTVNDANSCSATASVTISQASAVSVTTSVTSNYNGVGVSCFTATDGSTMATTSGGTPIITYIWSNGQTTAAATGLLGGPQRVTVTDGNGCTATSSVTITQPNTLALSVDTIGPVVCVGNSNGLIDVSVSGGIGTITYLWSNGSTLEDIAGLIDSTYSVVATDANGCTTTDTMIVSTIGFIEIVVDTAFHVTCNGDSTGSIYTTATGDTTLTGCFSNVVVLNEIMYRPDTANGVDPNTGEYIELLGPPGANIGCYVLTDGDWTITIPPGTTIPADGIFTIGNNIIWGAGTFDLDAENCACFTEGTGGAALLILTDGGEFVALYDGAGVFQQGVIYGSPSVGNTPSGTNINTVGTGGCPSSVFIPTAGSFETAPSGFANGTSIIRNPDGTGAWGPQIGGSLNDCNISGTGSTGNGTVTYIWSNGATTQDVTGLGAGSYAVTATNAYGCTATTNYTITQPTAITATIASSTSATCNGSTDGTATVMGAGGTVAYTYIWSASGQTTAMATGLAAGTYYVTVNDANNCMDSTSIVISEPTAVTATISTSTSVSCNGGNNGAATVVGTGGTVAYTYLWSAAAQTTATITGLTAGTYYVTVTDGNNCMDTDSIVINESTAVTATLVTSSNVFCNGGNDGTITVMGAGGTGPLTYLWNPSAQTDAMATGLMAGTYTVTVSDGNNCMDSISMTITEPTALVAVIDSSIAPSCGLADGTIYGSASGGTATNPYTYLWSNAATTAMITGVPSGTYIVTITDDNNCMDTVSISINQAGGVTVAIDTVIHAACSGGSNGSITVEGADGTGPYTYNWSNSASTTETITGLVAGSYSVTIIDAGGCTNTLNNIIVNGGGSITATASSTNITCNGLSNGTATAAGSGGTSPYAYVWGANAQTTQTATGLGVGVHNVTITDTNGCSANISTTITEPSVISSVSSTTSVTCFNGTSGTATVTPSGGTVAGNYAYTWGANAANQTTATATGLVAGTYNVTITDDNTCSTTATLTVTQAPAVSITYNSTPVGCNGTNDGSATAIASGGNGGFNYLWGTNTGGQTTSSATDLTSAVYAVTVTDVQGCTATATGVFVASGVPVDSANVPLVVLTGMLDCDLNPIGALGISTSNNYTYLWSNGAMTQNATGLGTGNYSVTITNGLGCFVVQSGTVSSPFVPSVNPYIGNIGTISTTVGTGVTATISGGNDQSGLGVSYVWTSSSSNPIIGNNTNHTTNVYASQAGIYVLTITATSNTSGCTDTGSVTLNVESKFLGMPNAFAPDNSDFDGNNLFRPVGLDPSQIIRFRIFNRWGQEVYIGDKLENNGWNGNYLGAPQAGDVYLYLLEYTDGGTKVIRGEFTLLR